jgi:hypothetical protein
VVAGAVLAWALVADALVLYIGIAPLLAVGLVLAYQQIVVAGCRPAQAWYELSLATAALVALAVGLALPGVIHALGGYSVVPAPQSFALASQMGTRLWLTVAGGLLLFGGDFFGLRLGFDTALVLLHLAGVALAGWAVCAGVRRFLRGTDLVTQLLVAGTLIVVAAYLFCRQVPGIGYSHEMAPALPFAAVLAGRLLRALQVNRASVSASHWESKTSWYDPRRYDANFVVLFSGQPGFSGQAGLSPFEPLDQVRDTFGPPAATYRLGRYTVLLWHQNLLRRLS